MASFVFLYPYWLVAIIPLFILCLWLFRRKNSTGLIAPHLAKQLGFNQTKNHKPLSIGLALSGIVAIVALSGPSFQKAEQPSFDLATARVLVMDMSMSLYATDIQPNRLTQARYKALDLLPLWKEGATGLIAYAGDAYTVSPLTSDTNTLHALIPNLSPDIMPYQGADAASAVKLAIEMLTNAGNHQGQIILISDDIDDREYQEIQELNSSQQWELSFLAIGTEEGAPIKLSDGSLLKQSSGATVIAKSNLGNMQSLSQSTGGVFAPFQHSSSDVELIAHQKLSNQGRAKKHSDQRLTERVNNGFWLVPLLLIPGLFLFRKGGIWSVALLFLPLAYPTPSQANPWKTDDQQAYQSFENEDFQSAAQQFSNQSWKGAAQYKAGDYQSAIETLTPLSSEDDQYNLANAYAQSGQLDDAIAHYQKLLKNNPNHALAKKNLDIVEQAKQQQQQQQQQDSKQNQEQNDNASQSQESDKDQSSQQNKQSGQQGSKNESAQNDRSEPHKGSEKSDSEQKGDHSGSQPKPEPSDENDTQAGSSQARSPQAKSPQAEQSQTEPSQDKPSEGTQLPEEKDLTDPQAANRPSTDSYPEENSKVQQVDPDVRRLEQVESARDPSRLLRAQMLLQAQQRNAPQQNNKKW